jgi:hypothetical protein
MTGFEQEGFFKDRLVLQDAADMITQLRGKWLHSVQEFQCFFHTIIFCLPARAA